MPVFLDMIHPCFVAILGKTDWPCTINDCKEQNISLSGSQAGNNQLYCERSQAEFGSNIKIYRFNLLPGR
jgi:hypothetical protein